MMDETGGESSLPSPLHKVMKLTEVSFTRIKEAGMGELYDLALAAGIQDDTNLDHSEDLRQRLILMKRKMEGSSNTWKHLFQSVKEETNVKSETLIELMKIVEATFQTLPIDSLSEILRKGGHLRSRNLLQELSKRIKDLIEHRSLVIIAGETNGGKSTFLNLILGEDILPTDILHCTFAICKIVYSTSYSIKTVDHNDHVEFFPCTSRDQAKTLLKSKVAQQEMKERALGSPLKEITLSLPADILKSGVTLVDTPGIGENEDMDNVTINYVKSTHASAFIYIIKSDTAGGVQEDRLLGFLRAIKERYSADTEVEAFDPRAAIFVCHRWDNIEKQQKEKVKQNALQKLEYVWPGFEPSQTYFFSTTKTMKHLPFDPEFVTDSFMKMLKGLKQLFERASHNAIKHHYIWLKYMLQPASHHLRSMITHCTHNNDELELYFKNVAMKQNRLMLSSEENSKKLQSELDILSLGLREEIFGYLNFDRINICHEIHECKQIIEVCSKQNFLYSRTNRWLLDEMIIRRFLKYIDEHIHERKTVNNMESKILIAIQDHLGLFRSQIHHIKHSMQHGGNVSLISSLSRTSQDADEVSMQLGASTASMISTNSNNSSVDSLKDGMTFDTTQLAFKVKSLLLRRKDGKSRSANNSKHEFQESLMSKVKSKVRHGILHRTDPEVYVEERMHKVAKDIREDSEIMNNIVHGYTEWIQQCVNYATNSIPKFIEVNNKLMDEIREHRTNFQINKELLLKVMEDLEPSRHQLRGYGLLYMDDINAEMLVFNTERWNSTVLVPKELTAEHKLNDDSGFLGSGSRKRKVHRIATCLWAKMKGATIEVNDVKERVVVKTYIYDMDDKAILSEIASLRCLEHTNLAPFLGMTRIVATGSVRGDASGTDNLTEKVSAFIFKGDLVSAHVYSTKKLTNMRIFVPDLVHCLLKGLNYIHREGLVHMELNLNTVMVDRVTGTVQICQMCKPREARFPANLNTFTQSCVCLSPKVLQGHEYGSTDDIYALGLLLWELLFPDELPYKLQRTWPLKKFIEECHPINMLQEALMQLNVSEDLRKVLKGTLLVPGRHLCMPIATVQSLTMDISNEPAVLSMRSRREQVVYRRTSSGQRLVLDLVTAKTSAPEVAIETLSPELSPQRPPRMKDKLRVDVSIKNPKIVSKKNVFPPKDNRRKSAPEYLLQNSSLSSVKPKKNIFKTLGNILGRRSSKSQLNEKLQETDEIASEDTNTTEYSDMEDGQIKSSESSRHSSPKVKPKYKPNHVRKEIAHNSKSHSRRLSLQNQPHYSSQKVSLQEDENFDVPSLMFTKFPTNCINTPIKNDSPSANPATNLQSKYCLNCSMPSLYLSDEPSRNIEAGFYHRRSLVSDIGRISQSVSSVHNQQANFFVLESTASGVHATVNGSPKQSPRLLGRQFVRSLHDLSEHSSSHVNHTPGLETENKVKSPVGQFMHDRFTRQRLGNSLQDISVNHSIGPIIEEKGDTSVLLSDRTRRNVTSAYDVSPSLKRGFHRLSAPASCGQPEKLLSPNFRAAGEDVDSSSSLASSLSSSLGHSSGISADLSGQEQKRIHGNAAGINVDIDYDQENVFKLWSSSAVKKSNDRRYLSFEHNGSQIMSNDNFEDTSQSQDSKTNLLKAKPNKYSNSNYTDSLEVFSADSLQRTTHFSFVDTSHHSELVSEKYPLSQTPRASNDKIPPPPPVIDFSKLSFGTEDVSDD